MSISKRCAWRWLSLIALALLSACQAFRPGLFKNTSQWVRPGPDGRLLYQTTLAGDRIMDFSSAGYMGGGVALPEVPTKQTVQPSGTNDDSDAIQAAVDVVSALPLDGDFRGAVVLGPGSFTCSKTIAITANGVVVRGSGSAAGGTTIKMTGSRHTAFALGRGRGVTGGGPTIDDEAPDAAGNATSTETVNAQTTISDMYVPAGSAMFSVADSSRFAVGDTIVIRRPTTRAWVKFMGMNTLQRNGRPQTWIAESRSEMTERNIVAISGRTLTVDVPLADSYDGKFLNPPGTTVTRVKDSAAVRQVGVEHLHLQCPPLEISYGRAPYSAVRINGDDCWVKDVCCEETMNATAMRGKRITLEQVTVQHTFPNLGASKPTDFSIEGSQILIDRCRITGDNMYFVWTAGLCPGPNVVLNSVFRGRGSRIQPHMRWSTGLLVDNCTVPDGGIDFANRGVTGSGHGWTMGWAVAWNCVAASYVIQNPPGAANWAIGCIGRRDRTARYFDIAPILPEGIFDSYGTPVTPQSLYLAQLNERLGPGALKQIGYAANTTAMFPDKSTPRLAFLKTDVDPALGRDLAEHRPVNTGNVRDRLPAFSGEKALDGNPATYWATDDGARRATLEVDMEGSLAINALAIEEAAGHMGQVRRYRVEGQADSEWKLLAEGTTIGEHQVHSFPMVTVWKVRLTILETDSYPAIRKFGVYRSRPN